MRSRFTYEEVAGTRVGGPHFRVTDTARDSRVATCYVRENAELVVDLMNRGEAAANLLEAAEDVVGRFGCIDWSSLDDAACIEALRVALTSAR